MSALGSTGTTTATVSGLAGRFVVEADGTPHRARFANVARAEWIKVRTVRSTWITLSVTAVLGIGLGALISYLAGNHYSSLSVHDKAIWDPTATSFDGLGVAQLAVAVFGALLMTSEYGTRMIATSLAATPRRTRFLAAKAAVGTGVALVVGEITSFAAYLVGQAAIGTNAPHTDLGDPDVLRAVIGAGLYIAVIALLAIGIGAIVRSSAGAVSLVVAVLFVLPAVLQALPSSWANPVTEYWPTQAGDQIFVLHRDAHTLSAWSGFGVLVGFTAVVLLIASRVIERRDA